jgi:hypothetical protein
MSRLSPRLYRDENYGLRVDHKSVYSPFISFREQYWKKPQELETISKQGFIQLAVDLIECCCDWHLTPATADQWPLYVREDYVALYEFITNTREDFPDQKGVLVLGSPGIGVSPFLLSQALT